MACKEQVEQSHSYVQYEVIALKVPGSKRSTSYFYETRDKQVGALREKSRELRWVGTSEKESLGHLISKETTRELRPSSTCELQAHTNYHSRSFGKFKQLCGKGVLFRGDEPLSN